MLLNSQIQAFIHLDQETYAPGEQVNGTISMLVNTPVQATDLVLKFFGGEFVHFAQMEDFRPPCNSVVIPEEEETNLKEPNEQRPGYFTQNRVFYDVETPIYNFQAPGTVGVIKKGQYQFPFSFTLGPQAPASFNYNWRMEGHRCSAQVSYIMTAHVVDKNTESIMVGRTDSLAQREVLVVPREVMMGMNRRVEFCDKVKKLMCLDQGEIKVVAYFDKDQYSVGEKVQVILEIDNRRSGMDVQGVEVSLVQKLSFIAQGHEQTKRTVLKSVEGDGVESGRARIGGKSYRYEISISGKMADLSDILGSCHGELVNCRHRLNIELDLGSMNCCRENPELYLDFPVYKVPQMLENSPTFMNNSGWNPMVNSTFVFNPRFQPQNNLDISVNPYTRVPDSQSTNPSPNQYYRVLTQKEKMLDESYDELYINRKSRTGLETSSLLEPTDVYNENDYLEGYTPQTPTMNQAQMGYGGRSHYSQRDPYDNNFNPPPPAEISGRPSMLNQSSLGGGRPSMMAPPSIGGGRPSLLGHGPPPSIGGGRPSIIGGHSGAPSMLGGPSGRPSVARPPLGAGGPPPVGHGLRPPMGGPRGPPGVPPGGYRQGPPRGGGAPGLQFAQNSRDNLNDLLGRGSPRAQRL